MVSIKLDQLLHINHSSLAETRIPNLNPLLGLDSREPNTATLSVHVVFCHQDFSSLVTFTN